MRVYDRKSRAGFTLIELISVTVVLAILGSLMYSLLQSVRAQADISTSTSNIRQLVVANMTCLAETGRYVKGANAADNVRWHGSKVAGEWVGYGGYLTPYLSEDRKIRKCPVMEDLLDRIEGAQFDAGTGGYGYNAVYLGSSQTASSSSASGTPALGATRGSAGVSAPDSQYGNLATAVMDPARTVMFTSTALVRGNGIVETYLSAPYQVISNGELKSSMTPTTHFRFNGMALVGWCDGHVTLEAPNDASTAHNAYGDSNDAYRVGWFGPADNNGYWNPQYATGRPF